MRRIAVLSAALALVAAGAAACSSSAGHTSTGTAGSAAFDPKTCQGGTLEVLNQDSISKMDPARIYTSGGGNIPSLLFRTLTTRNRQPGQDGAKPAPDLATDLGTPSDGAKTWTYHLKSDIFFEDGTPITAQDVKYGIERSFAPELPGGAPYLRDWLVDASNYQGPYKDPNGIAAIETPDAKTIIFHLRKPEGDFPLLATATQFAPVPKAKDTGVNYDKHPISSGPYMVASYDKGKTLDLVRNPHWSAASDPLRYACPDKIDVTSGLNPAVINQRIATGSGQDANAVTTDATIGPDQLAQLNSNPSLAKRVARGEFPATTYLAFNTKVKPFDDIRVREAVSYAINRTTAVNAAGGTAVAGASTTFLPPQKALGYQPYDDFPAGATGDAAKAKDLLAQAGYPNGLTITLFHQSDDANNLGPKEATAIQDALKAAGITVKLNPVDDDSYQDVTGKPSSEPGVSLQYWGADWPSGAPFLIPIFDGREIIDSGGNFNMAQLNDPGVNAEIDAINAITDPAQAQARWGALDAKLGQQALTVPLFYEKDVYLFGKNVKDAVPDGWRGQYDLARVSVK
ncbi:extracellular solute-binding protein family 5 [Catenulispora acidiphila DSM 44928]|uniref:Extracellular solute-binding protein family 5 n=1 Tax=Catenulispora acidiphila (strain DSM 44928 / JCM 14897 / NBRC 102108 / NRRL B-24433 / ID139908) TaxID=479433 RepID=C7PXV9_CATAD|nr:ABC transporter substrate-binding protein [Catenulispora acidiphila]ACU73419.1 extracellular solute-binding protein family 5 [Catenulispora acidiphila DSM 44928]